MDEWELSKENVQPLRQGRQMASLTAGLQPQMDQIRRIKDEKHAFEAELRTYTGDDPLDNWYKYIRWAEQAYPKGGADSNVTTILERCLKLFKEDERYRNDERYIYAWMKMADVCNEPLDIYSFMYDRNIGCEVSSFYIGWASVYEQLGNTKKADAIYLKGMNKNARPFETLKHRHEEFQKRVARMTMEGHEFNNPDDPPAEPSWAQSGDPTGGQRQVLSQLRATGKKHTAPINRTGNAILGSAGVVSGARPKTNQQVSKSIKIYQDENQTPSSIPPQTNEWKSIPKRDVINKENQKKAGVWTGQKLGKSGINVPISAVSAYRQPSFSVHVDETDASFKTPLKKPELAQPVLSARKEKPTSTIDYLRSMTANPNPNEKPMYCKEKIYCGVEEFTFEELRAFKWKEKKEKEQLELCRQRLENEKRLLLEEAERVKNERLKIREEVEVLISDTQRGLQEQRARMELESQKEFEQHKRLIEETIQRRMQEHSLSLSNSFSSRGQSSEDENLSSEIKSRMNISHTRPEATNTSNRALNSGSAMQTTPEGAGMSNRVANNEQVSQSRPGSLNTSNRIPNSGGKDSNNTSTTDRTEQAMFGSASPTVNTREALMLVRGMFNSSLESNQTRIDEEMETGDNNPPPATGQGGPGFSIFDENQNQPAKKTNAARFEIYDENQGRSERQLKSTKVAPFKVFDENQENRPKKKSGVLPFTVFQDSAKDTVSPSKQTETPMLTSPVHPVRGLEEKKEKTVGKQGLAFKRSQPLFEEENMERIESHARDDITLAPVGSHLSFAEAARFASTPFNKAKDSGNPASSLNDTEFEIMDEGSKGGMNKTENESTNRSLNSSIACNTGLSPIMEGSNEDSGASSKSGHPPYMSRHEPNLSTIDGTPGTSEPPEDTMALLQFKPLDEANNSNTHVIDVSGYSAPDLDEKTENFLSMSVYVYDPEDPFDADMKNKILEALDKPLMMYRSFDRSDEYLPEIRKGLTLSLGMQMCKVISKIGQGGFAKVFVVELEDEDLTFDLTFKPTHMAMKVEEPCQFWEFYIVNEVHKRLGALKNPVDVRPAMMNIEKGLFFRNGSCLITDYHCLGTLLDLANLYKNMAGDYEQMSQHTEPITAYMTIELLHMIEQLHKCNIIHGDIKPDNFMFLQFPELPDSQDPTEVFSGCQRFAQLIDFGQSIDMTKYTPGTTFMTKVTTRCFQCTEMKTDRPWTYQTDYFGLAGTIHVLIFKQYMNVYQTGEEWKMTSSFDRCWNKDLWRKLFHVLLNVPSCDKLPNLSELRREFEEWFVRDLLRKYNEKCTQFNNIVARARS